MSMRLIETYFDKRDLYPLHQIIIVCNFVLYINYND